MVDASRMKQPCRTLHVLPCKATCAKLLRSTAKADSCLHRKQAANGPVAGPKMDTWQHPAVVRAVPSHRVHLTEHALDLATQRTHTLSAGLRVHDLSTHLSKNHLTAQVLEVGLHGQGQTKLVRKEHLGGDLAHVDALQGSEGKKTSSVSNHVRGKMANDAAAMPHWHPVLHGSVIS